MNRKRTAAWRTGAGCAEPSPCSEREVGNEMPRVGESTHGSQTRAVPCGVANAANSRCELTLTVEGGATVDSMAAWVLLQFSSRIGGTWAVYGHKPGHNHVLHPVEERRGQPQHHGAAATRSLARSAHEAKF